MEPTKRVDIVNRLRNAEEHFHEIGDCGIQWLARDAAAEIERLRKGIQDCINGDYDRPIIGYKCKHERTEWEDCEPCIDEHLEALLK